MTVLTIYIDFKSPAAYLAMKPTLALIEKHALDVDWRPFKTVQQSVPPEEPTDQKPEIHRRVRALARRNTHLTYADVQGVPMNFQDPPGVTDLALAALTDVAGSPVDFIQAAFKAYWVDGADLNDPQVVAALLTDSGHDAHLLDGIELETVLAEAQARAHEDGVVDAPGYVIGDQVFIGREHLPWVISLIRGA